LSANTTSSIAGPWPAALVCGIAVRVLAGPAKCTHPVLVGASPARMPAAAPCPPARLLRPPARRPSLPASPLVGCHDRFHFTINPIFLSLPPPDFLGPAPPANSSAEMRYDGAFGG